MTAASFQQCESCVATSDERDPRTECAICGALLEIVHPARHDASTLRALFAVAARRVDRCRAIGRLALPRARAAVRDRRGDRHASRGQHTAVRRETESPTSFGVPGLAHQARRAQSDRVVQGSRHDGRDDAGASHRCARRRVRVDRQHVGVARRVCGARGNSRAGLRARRTRSRRARSRRRSRTARKRCWFAELSTTASRSREKRVRRSASICSTPSIRSGSRDRRRSCSSCSNSSTGTPPDWIVLPAGNLGNTSAFGKALREAHAIGLIDRMPRIAAIQASGAAPFATSFRDGISRAACRVEPETVATAIRIGAPASWKRAVRTIRETRRRRDRCQRRRDSRGQAR